VNFLVCEKNGIETGFHKAFANLAARAEGS
jgi:hypothetical protein